MVTRKPLNVTCYIVCVVITYISKEILATTLVGTPFRLLASTHFIPRCLLFYPWDGIIRFFKKFGNIYRNILYDMEKSHYCWT